MGHDAVKESVVKRKARLVLFTSDSSERLRSEITSLCKCKCITMPFTMDEFSLGIGKKSAVFSVNDDGFAAKFILMFGEEYYAGNK